MDFCQFISGWFIKPEVCDDLIQYFEKTLIKVPGHVGLAHGTTGVAKTKKDSTDVYISPHNQDKEVQNYFAELKKTISKYKKQYPYCDKLQCGWGLVEDMQIQKYLPKQGYFQIHTEKTGKVSAARHLVFMTYLNDVKDGGETEFYYQKIKVKPKKGLTLIWGSDWTFMHKGIVSPTETKYITTGWFSYT